MSPNLTRFLGVRLGACAAGRGFRRCFGWFCLEQRQKAQHRVRADRARRAHPLAAPRAHGDAVAALDVGHGARGHVANATLEARAPVLVGRAARVDRVDHVRDVAPDFARSLAHDQLLDALAPVDVARVVAFAHRAQRQDLVARAAPERGVAAQAVARQVAGQLHGIDRGIDDQIAIRASARATFRTGRTESAWRRESRRGDRDRAAPACGGRPRPAPNAG